MKTSFHILFFRLFTLVLPSGFCPVIHAGNITPFAAGFTKPVCIAHTSDSRLFVVSQPGYIYIVDSAGNVAPQPFLDIHERVILSDEQGLLGLAFHPHYSSNGYFFVYYVGNGDSLHISRFSVTSNPAVADPLSELMLMTIYHPYTNHNGGDLNFGPDGYLYMGTGDGGSGGDPGNRAQNPLVLLGKLLRIDVDHGNPYAIPPTNPFYGSSSTLNEIWALGLRNPWRFSFDKLTGDLWIGDVGQDSIEEIDYRPAGDPGGENYGWRCWEGNLPYNSTGCPPDSVFTFPVYTYPHDPECAVTGGYVYRGSPVSSYYGYYFFADYCSDRIWTLHNESGSWVKQDFGIFPGNNFSTFGEDAAGRIYIAGVGSGTVFRVVDNPEGINSAGNPAGITIIQDPVSGTIRIETGRTGNPEIQVTLCDTKGSILYSSTPRVQDFEFNPGAMPSGIYILSLRIDAEMWTRKLVRMN